MKAVIMLLMMMKMYSMYHSMESGKMAWGDQYGETWMMILLVEDVANEDEDELDVPLYGVRQDGNMVRF